nr:hypothetical protein [Tanacetum cinerariifolium]
MDTTIDQQVARDEALVPHVKRLRIGRSNFRLCSRNLYAGILGDSHCSSHSIRFKMDNKKHIVNLESFREMLHICPRLPHQPFVEPPFEEEILAFLRFLGHSAVIRRLTDVNINKLHHLWRAFASIINKCLTGKSSGYDSLRLNTKIQRRAMRCIIFGSRRLSSTTSCPRLTTSEKGKQTAKASKAKSLSALYEESFDPIPKTPEDTDDEGNGEENLGLNVGRKEGHDKEEEEDELHRDQSSSVSSQFVTSKLNPALDVGMESIFETTSQMDVKTPTSVAPLPMSTPTITSSSIATITTTQQAPTLPITAPSTLLQDLPNFGSLFRFDHRLKTLEANFSEFSQTNQFDRTSDRLQDEAQVDNDEFLKTIGENMQKIIKEQVKEQVKVQVSKILPKIEQTVNDQLEAEVLTRSSNSSKTSYAIATDLSEMELKKILIEKMEGNKSIQRSNEQRNLYKALVEAYESDKIILDTYGDTVTLKRRRDDKANRDEEPSAGSD